MRVLKFRILRPLIGAVRALSARRRLLVSTCVGCAVFLLFPTGYLLDTRLLLGWDGACFTFLAMAWMVISLADAKETRRRTLDQDQSGFPLCQDIYRLHPVCKARNADGHEDKTARIYPACR